MRRSFCLGVVILVALLTLDSFGADWPQHRRDVARSAASPESLPAELHLQWVRELPAPRPAFPAEIRLRYDATYQPVVAGKAMFVPSMVTDSVTALDTETGAQRWCFFAEGPVRFAPVAWQGKVYFVSDDGYLYCVQADDGKLLWKFRGLPADRKDRRLLGDGRLISLFPARGGPVLADGIVYFAAGVWPGDGVFVHALDAESGKPIWSNVDSHHIEKANMDHGVGYFAGLTPQGYLAIVDGRLVIPCGAQLPGLLDLKTGKLETYTMGWGGRVGLPKGSWFVAGAGKYLLHGGDLYDVQTPNQERFRDSKGRQDFKRMLYLAGVTRLQIDRTNQKGLGNFRRPVLTPEAMYEQQGGIVAYDLTKPALQERAKLPIPDYRRNDQYPDRMKATFPELWRLASKLQLHIKAGDRLYGGERGVVAAVELPKEGRPPRIAWQATVEGTPQCMLAADAKLFVVTREGRIYTFGEREKSEPLVHGNPTVAWTDGDEWTGKATAILQAAQTGDGYILVLGIGSGRLVEELVRQSPGKVIAVDPDAGKAARLRARFHRAGLYGTRVVVLAGDPMSYPLPPLMAELVVSEDPAALGDALDRTFARRLFHCLRPYGGTACLAIPAARRDAFVKEVSAAALAGATLRQANDLVLLTRQGPLAGAAGWSHRGANAANTGASRDRFVEAPLGLLWFDGSLRWPRTPGAAVVRIVGGRVLVKSRALRAIDVYTGRPLWEAALPGGCRPGDDMIATEQAVYLAAGKACVALDAATGKESARIELPGPVSSIRIGDDRLIAAGGKHLFCLDLGGELIWRHECRQPIGSTALGGGKVFCGEAINKRRGETVQTDARTWALDLNTGKVLWQIAGGGEVRYSEPLELLFTSSGAYRADDGTRAQAGSGPLRITDERLLAGEPGLLVIRDLRTGERIGKELQWNRRGCTGRRASVNLVTTRFQGNAAYVDLATGRIASLWGIRAACSNNLFPADGVLNVPNLTGGCTCNYTPASQALVPLPLIDRL